MLVKPYCSSYSFCAMSYQPNECYFVRKFCLFSRLRNIIVPEILATQILEEWFNVDDMNFKEFPSRNSRALPMFWQIVCPNKIFIGFYAEDRKSQQNIESMISLPFQCVTMVMAIGHG